MAKDGTARGGTRIGAGRKGKTLSTKIIEGNFSTEKISTAKKDFEPPTPKKYIDSKRKATLRKILIWTKKLMRGKFTKKPTPF